MALPSSILRRDTRANRPAATAVAAGTYFATTDESYVIERSDGTNWAVVANGPKIVLSTTDQSSSSTTLANDNELSFPVIANTNYWVRVVCWFTSGTSEAPDVKYTFTFPTGATISLFNPGLQAAATAVTSDLFGGNYRNTTGFTAIPRGVLSTATIPGTPFLSEGILKVSSTAGTFQLQFAQNTSDAQAITREADSFLMYQAIV